MTALNTRTEGWAASLQLAALALQALPSRDTPSVDRFVAEFSGSHRYVIDYLMEEVLDKQPTDLRTFLCQTSILERLTGPLCEVVTGQADGQAVLEKLERANLFVIPLDAERSWYRYHHLFAELLRYRQQRTQPDLIPELHRRAGSWYEQQGWASEAIHHFLAARDFQQATRVVEQNVDAMHWGRGELATARHWLEQLPPEIVKTRPRLCLAYAWALVPTGEVKTVEPYLRAIEVQLQHSEMFSSVTAEAGPFTAVEPATWGESERQRITSEIAGVRASMAWHRGDLPHAIEQYQLALEQIPDEELHLRGRIMIGLAEAYYLKGDVAAASQTYHRVSELGRRSHSLLASLAAMARLVNLQVLQGQLRRAAETCQQMQHLVATQAEPQLAVAGIVDTCLGDLLREWNDLEQAEQQFQQGIERGQQSGNPLILLNSYIGLARVLQAGGNPAGATEAILAAQQAERQYQVTWTRGGPPVSAYQARVWLMQGQLAAAGHWAEEQKLQATDAISFQHELDYLTLARLLIAQGQTDPAISLLDRLQRVAESGGRWGRVLEAQLLKALAYQAQGNSPRAQETLNQVLTQAESEGYVRLFVDEGDPMRGLLTAYKLQLKKRLPARQQELMAYTDQLIAAFAKPTVLVRPHSKIEPPLSQRLVDPLSERELEVLRLMAAGQSNLEIARTLVITVGTVKSHNNHIFGKLNAKNRAEAVACAKAYGLL